MSGLGKRAKAALARSSGRRGTPLPRRPGEFGPPGEEAKTLHGFTIVTADAQGGMVDVHGRRPVVLTADDASTWLDPDLPGEQAEHFIRSVALGPESFAWHPIDKAMGNVRNDGPHVIRPIELA